MDSSQLLQKSLKQKFLGLLEKSGKFWFEAEAPARIRLFRQVFGALLLCMYLARWSDLEFFYSESGILPLEIRNDWGFSVMPSLFAAFPSTGFLWGAYFVLLLSLGGIILGVFPRVCSAIAYLIHVSFVHRNLGSMYGVDLIAVFYLAYSAFMCARTSASGSSDWSRIQRDLSSVAFRLAQIQLCIIYLYAGIGKLKGGLWWSGEALWTVLANVQLTFIDFHQLAHYPILVALMTYSVLAWEIYFPVVIWLRGLRYPMLIYGVLMHIGIAVTMNLVFFAAVMMSVYLLFLDERHAQKVENWIVSGLSKGLSRLPGQPALRMRAIKQKYLKLSV